MRMATGRPADSHHRKGLELFAPAMAVVRLLTGENKVGGGEETEVFKKRSNRFQEPLNKESGNHVFLQCR